MAEELLERVMREIRERKLAARAAVEEYTRLERALAALGQGGGASADGAATTRSRPARRLSTQRKRAPRGTNRDAVLAVVRETPGVSAGGISQASGIARSTVSPTLARLVDSGAIERTELPDGGVGFRVPREAPASESGEGSSAPASG